MGGGKWSKSEGCSCSFARFTSYVEMCLIVMEHETTDAVMLILYLTSHGHGDIAYAGMESSICKMD